MSNLLLSKKVRFDLPAKGALEPNDRDDPLAYYYHPLVGFLYRNRIKQALSLLSLPYQSVLEIGYGSGIMLSALASISRQVSGIDITSDPQRVKANLKKLGIDASLVKGDIVTADYLSESFDLIVAISMLEHIKDLDPLLNKIFSLLRPGGYFLVGMPRVDNLMKVIFSLIGFNNIAAHHVTNYGQFLKASSGKFTLVKSAKLPLWAPEFMSLYFNALLRKSG
ncbi:MAG TPA: class I SAM-dependent methyltransferase [Candidatus Omnitrophica bacterium]|nr:class I SAM-dependent methyltransferase [Candidatus Omnitrophota bacterium]